jgi:hypothetical protein
MMSSRRICISIEIFTRPTAQYSGFSPNISAETPLSCFDITCSFAPLTIIPVSARSCGSGDLKEGDQCENTRE